MKSKIVSSVIYLGAASAAFAIGLAGKNRKVPDLKVDSTPIAETKAPGIASYADVVEPVQKAVVSVYSKKFVREQLAINPFTGRIVGGGQRAEPGLGSGVIISADG